MNRRAASGGMARMQESPGVPGGMAACRGRHFALGVPLMLALLPAWTDGVRAADESRLERGKSIYEAKCSQCHGENGDGQAVGAEYYHPLPRDFTYGAFKIRTTESGELPTHRDLQNIIRRGMPYTGMPPWPSLSEADLDAVAAYIRTFNEDFADPELKPIEVEIPEAPPFSEESAQKGRKIYEANKCMDCHGEGGRGDGESGPELTDDWGHHSRPADLTKPWTFRGGARRQDIYRTIVTGLNGTPMPSYASSIKEEDRWALVDYIHDLSRMEKAPYGTVVVASPAKGEVDLSRGDSLFAGARPVLFPVVGQVIEDPRCFQPGVNAVEVSAVYDSAYVAIRLRWHDMSAETGGGNSPVTSADTVDRTFSDAAAVQIPSEAPEGQAKPYLLFGDRRLPADFWFADLGRDTVVAFTARGSGDLKPREDRLEILSGYRDGRWSVVFKRPRRPAEGMPFEAGQFIPIAFSVWDGFNGETGNRRGITSWYSLYLQPPRKVSPVVPAAAKAGMALGIELLLLLALRFHYRRRG